MWATLGLIGGLLVLLAWLLGRGGRPQAPLLATPGPEAEEADAEPVATLRRLEPDPSGRSLDDQRGATAARVAVPSTWSLEVEVRGLDHELAGPGQVRLYPAVEGEDAMLRLGPLRSPASPVGTGVQIESSLGGVDVSSKAVAASDPVAHFEIPNERREVAVVASTPGFHHTPARAVRSTGRMVIELVPIPPVVIHLPGLVDQADSYWVTHSSLQMAAPFSTGDGPIVGSGQLDPSGSMVFDSAPYRGSLSVNLYWRGGGPEGNLISAAELTVRVAPEQREFAIPDVVCHMVDLVPPVSSDAFKIEFDLEPSPEVDLSPSRARRSGYGLRGKIHVRSETGSPLRVSLLSGTASRVRLSSESLGEIDLEPFEVSRSGVVLLERAD